MIHINTLFFSHVAKSTYDQFGHAGVPLRSFLGTLVITEGGLWGSLTGVSVGVVSIFVIFGAVLNAGSASQTAQADTSPLSP